MTRIAIMQPTYLPWMGYLDLMAAVDQFVVLDDVAFSHQSWHHRNRIRTSKGLTWLTIPVTTKGRSGQLISEVTIGESSSFPENHLNLIRDSYRSAPFCNSIAPIMEIIRSARSGSRLIDLTTSIMQVLAELLAVTTPWIFSSSLGCPGQRSAKLVNICSEVGADVYVTPPGAVGYLQKDQRLFHESGVSVLVHRFEHPKYAQVFEPFVSHTSVIDAFCTVGIPGTVELIRSGHRSELDIDEFEMRDGTAGERSR